MRSRRFWLSIVGILVLGAIGRSEVASVAWPIAAICMGVAGANAWESRSVLTKDKKNVNKKENK